MELHLWFSLVLICLLGAMSPGPSLALVIKNTIKGGTTQGYATAISHGLAVGLYAAITATGIGIIIVKSPTLYSVIQYAGAAFLFYLGAKSLWAAKNELMTKKANSKAVEESVPNINQVVEKVSGWRDGFLIAFLNPKLAIFFLALFSQFVDESAHWIQNAIMALTAGTIDLLWYLLITFGISRGGFIEKLKRNSVKVDIITGVFLMLLAMRVVMS
jgi:threonine/homoserine/homoserine lactone efflux protein